MMGHCLFLLPGISEAHLLHGKVHYLYKASAAAATVRPATAAGLHYYSLE